MSARIILRFDDICPTMNWDVWDEVDSHLAARHICPLLAVVPDNRDEALAVKPPRDEFWACVRSWQSRGWTIAAHGLHHIYETKEAGLLGLNHASEFAGLSGDVQLRKLIAAREIFANNGIDTDVWVAPAHSFDDATLDALAAAGVKRVSDGFHITPGRDRRGLLWVPQQLWSFRRPPFGVWTIAFHINAWSASDVASFAADLDRHRAAISDFETVSRLYANRRLGVTDAAVSRALLAYTRFRAERT